MAAEGVEWGVREALGAATVNELRRANWLTEIVNTDDKSSRRRLVNNPPEMVEPPGEQPKKRPPGPDRKRRQPMPRHQLESLGFQVKEVDDGP